MAALPFILWLAEAAQAPVSALETHGLHVRTALDLADAPLTWLADHQPALIVLDAAALPGWVAEIRSNPATRRIPIVAIAETDAQNAAARYVGINHTLSAAEVVNVALLLLLASTTTAPTPAAIADACAETLPALAIQGFEEFNDHDFFECHESLEAAWKADSGPARDLYRVVLQVGLAYYQIERSNFSGAQKMFLRTQQWFLKLPDHCRGVDLGQLRSDAAAARAHLEQLGPDRITQFDMTLIRPLQWTT